MKELTKLEEQVLLLIPKHQADAITSKQLIDATGISFRQLKEVITELRVRYPICSKETNGGGYWLAENSLDIRNFITMISRRRDGYNNTIEVMQNHLDCGVS